MEARERLDRLNLDDDQIIDDEVEAVAGLKRYAVIDDRQPNLLAHHKPAFGQFVGETVLVDGLK